MKLALWDLPPADVLRAGFESSGIPNLEVLRARPEVCAGMLLEKKVDAALVPTTMVLKAADGFDIIPGIALSTWHYPFAKLVLKGGLRDWPERIIFDRRAIQEKLVARIVLHEHYGIQPEFQPTKGNIAEVDEPAVLLSGRASYRADPEDLVLDLGREWFELSNYPMVWGLLVTRREHLAPEQVSAIIETAAKAEEQQQSILENLPADSDLFDFIQDDVRVRFDDLATASLTELKRYMFYYNELDDMPDLHFAEIEEGEDEEDQEEPLV